MRIIICDVNTGVLYGEIEDATASQIAAYSNSDVVVVDDKEYLVECVLSDYNLNHVEIQVIDDSQNIDIVVDPDDSQNIVVPIDDENKTQEVEIDDSFISDNIDNDIDNMGKNIYTSSKNGTKVSFN